MSNLSSMYADALFEIALEENRAAEILDQSTVITQVIKENRDFARFLAAPMIEKDEKTDFVDKVFGGHINKNLLNFMKVMIQRKDAAVLTESLVQYEKLYNKHFNIEKAVAVTAVPMSRELQAKLTEKLEKVTGKTIVLTNKVDEGCLGGVILQFSDMQINDSIAQKLETLKNQLKNINR
ncbi:MAG: ATP synthase F1 subunit delta [Oscillospiraceae bacterium]|nr:ATP synthase F1 subunit delta [Oscillospiraceae bacterium]